MFENSLCEVSLHKYLTKKYFKLLEKSREISFGENPILCPFKCVVCCVTVKFLPVLCFSFCCQAGSNWFGLTVFN